MGLSLQPHVLADCLGMGDHVFVPVSQGFVLFRSLSPVPTSQGPQLAVLMARMGNYRSIQAADHPGRQQCPELVRK